MSTTTAAASPRWTVPVLMIVTLVLLAILGAGAIALERPVGQAEGLVLSVSTGKPLADARVTVGGPVTRTAMTGPDGKFKFNNLPVGAYVISARADRYDPQWLEGEVTVAEGKVASALNFKLSRTLPALEVASSQRVWLPGEETRVSFRGTQLSQLDVTVYKLDLDKAVRHLEDMEPLRRGELTQLHKRGVLTPVKTWQQEVRREEVGEDHWFHKPLQMPELAPGAYVVSVAGNPDKAPEDLKAHPRMERGYWFNVSQLALVTKRSQNQLLLYAVDLKTKQPVPGAKVRLVDKKGTVGTATADAQGLAWLKVTDDGTRIALGSAAGSPAVVSNWAYGSEQPFKIYAYTERPVYRPGQRVYFKALVRAEKEARYTSATGREAAVTVKDSTGAEIMSRRYPLNSQSAFDGEIELPAEAPLGEYDCEIAIGKEAYEHLRFKVAEYRKPEFKVEITPAKPRYRLGDTANVSMLASYYFGAPTPGAKLNVTVFAAPLYDGMGEDESFFTGYTSEPGVEPFWGFGDVVHQEEGVTDKDGKYTLNVPIAKPEAGDEEAWLGDRVYTVQVEGMDASNRPVKATHSFRVTQGDFRVRVDTDQSLYTGKTGMDVTLAARDYDDRPVKTDIDVTVYKLIHEEKKTAEGDEYTETRRESAFTGKATTDASGKARLTIPAMGEGSYVVAARATDAHGSAIVDQAYTWVAGDQWAGGTYRHGALQLVMDKKVYKPGDVAKVLVISPVPDVAALVTVEGVKLHSARVVRMKGASALVTIPVTADFKPNAFVAAAVVNGKEFMSEEKSLNVMPEDQFLKVTVSSDKRKYEPGEKATFRVETRDYTGKPVAADVSLGVVDQAVYAIEPDATPDIRGFFHGPRWNTISTNYSFAEDYSGGLDKFAPDPRVRARFEDTAGWFPNLRTDASGVAKVTVTLPDNLTTWVATARAATSRTQVGANAYNVVATKDLLVRLETPRFVVMGDHVEISAIVHNYTEAAQRVKLQLVTQDLTLRSADSLERSIPAGDAMRVAWEADVPDTGTAMARVIVRGQTASDAMELPMPALPYGVEDVVAFAGEAKVDNPGLATVTLPTGTLPSTVKLVVRPHTTPLPSILSGVDYLHQFEYGCVEQTMSRFLPDVALPRRLAAVGAPTGNRFNDKAARTADGVRRLLAIQHGDGGWGWWSHDESKVEMTAYVLYGLGEARRAGVVVPDQAINRAVEYLERQLPTIQKDVFTRHTVERNAGADLRALALFGLSSWRMAPDKEIDRLWKDRSALSHYGMAQLALVLADLRDQRRFEALDALEKGAEITETQASWPSTAAAYTWQDNATETTAYALRAYLAISPEAPVVPKVVRWLESKNAKGYWESTKDTGAAAIALAEYLAVRRPATGGTGLKVIVNDQEVASLPAADAWAAIDPIVVEASRLHDGANTVRVEAEGDVDFAGTLSYVAKADQLSAEGREGLMVNREYFLLPADVYARAKGQGTFAEFYDEKLVNGLPKVGGSVKAGERVLVRLTLKSDKGYRYMVAEDPLPAGCEILEDQPENWGYWWDHQEYRDEKAAFFFNRLEPGTKTLYYVMRPTTQGRFRVLPPRVWAMYTPELRARGNGGELAITE